MQTSEVLNKAADLIEERGWSQGALSWYEVGRSGPLCLEGGIQAALDFDTTKYTLELADEFSRCPAYRAMFSYLQTDARWGAREHLRVGGDADLYDWNDTEIRTAAEVIEVLRAAAVIEAAREEQDAAWETYAEVVSA